MASVAAFASSACLKVRLAMPIGELLQHAAERKAASQGVMCSTSTTIAVSIIVAVCMLALPHVVGSTGIEMSTTSPKGENTSDTSV